MGMRSSIRSRRPFRLGIGVLVALAAAGGPGFWIWRMVRESVTISRLAESVRSGSIQERRSAVGELGKVGPSDVDVAIPALVDALRDSDDGVREAAAHALGTAYRAAATAGPEGQRETWAASQEVLRGLSDERAGVRAVSAQAFAVIAVEVPRSEKFLFDPVPVVTALTGVLGDENEEVRIQAARAIGAIGHKVLVEPPQRLIAALQGDRSVGVRVAAAHALGRFPTGDSTVLAALLDGFSDPDPKVVGACATSIDASRPTPDLIHLLIKSLSRPERTARGAAAAVLARIGPDAAEAVPSLIALLKEPKRAAGQTRPFELDVDPAVMAAMALGRIAPGSRRASEAVAPLADLLRSESGWRRHAAAVALGLIGPTAATAAPALIEVLRDSIRLNQTWLYGTEAVIALGQVAPDSPAVDEAVASLIEALDERAEPTRANAAAALGRFGAAARPAVPHLRSLLDDPYPSVRQNAAASLQVIGP